MGLLTDAPDLDTRSGRKDFYFNLMHRVVGEVVPTPKWNPKGHKINIDNNAISLVATEGGVEAILAGGKREVFKEYSGLKEFVKKHMKDSLSVFQNAISILESDGFERGVDFTYFEGVLKFTSRARCDRAAGLLPTKDIKARGYDYIYLKDSAVVADESKSEWNQIVRDLEHLGFVYGTDFMGIGNEITFRTEEHRKRAEGFIETRLIASSHGKVIVLKDSRGVADAITKGATVGVPLKNSGTARATVVSVSGGMATVRITEGEHKGLEMDVATSILKDKAIIYAPVVDATRKSLIEKLRTVSVPYGERYQVTDGSGWSFDLQHHGRSTYEEITKYPRVSPKESSLATLRFWYNGEYKAKFEGPINVVKADGIAYLQKQLQDSETVGEFDLDNLPSEGGEQKVKLHTGGKVIEVEVESEEHEREERLGDSAFSDAVDLRKLADLINKAADKAEGNTISKSGVYATAEKDHISVSCANSNDVSQVARIVKGLIAVNSEANKTLSVSTSSHEVYVEFKDSRKAFTVKDKKGRELLVFAADSDEAVRKVRALNDAAFTVTARTNDFPYGNNLCTIVDANNEQEAVAKYRKVLEARGDKINSISARPTTATDKAKGISHLKDSPVVSMSEYRKMQKQYHEGVVKKAEEEIRNVNSAEAAKALVKKYTADVWSEEEGESQVAFLKKIAARLGKSQYFNSI